MHQVLKVRCHVGSLDGAPLHFVSPQPDTTRPQIQDQCNM